MRPQAEQKAPVYCGKQMLSGLALTDRLRLEQVLINIIGNAVKFTGEEGCGIFHYTGGRCSGGQRLTFSVKDTGNRNCQRSPGQHFQCF